MCGHESSIHGHIVYHTEDNVQHIFHFFYPTTAYSNILPMCGPLVQIRSPANIGTWTCECLFSGDVVVYTTHDISDTGHVSPVWRTKFNFFLFSTTFFTFVLFSIIVYSLYCILKKILNIIPQILFAQQFYLGNACNCGCDQSISPLNVTLGFVAMDLGMPSKFIVHFS